MSTTDDNAASADATPPLNYATPHEPEKTSDSLTRGDVACLAVKIVGLYCLVRVIPELAEYLGYFRASVSHVTSIIPLLVFGGMGVFLFMYGEGVARWLLPRTAVVTTELPGHALAQIQAIAFSIVGLLLFVWSGPYFVFLLVTVFLGDGGQAIRSTTIARFGAVSALLLRYGGEAALGIWLFFGSKRLATWWWGLRHPEFPGDSDAK